MSNFERAQRTLEFNKILDMLADCSHTEGAAGMALQLKPTADAERVRQLQEQTGDAKKLASMKGTPSFGFIKDINPALGRADRGAILTMREILDIAAVLRTARLLLDYINTDKKYDTSLDEHFGRLSPQRALEERIGRTVIAEDMIADEASPALSDIRRKKRVASNRIKEILQRYVSGENSKYLQENIITQRGGRFVVPVKNEYKNEIKGLVHDVSASGATVFVEPMGVVEANNELRELESKETHEIERILAELSAACAEDADKISLNYYNITELAFIFARAELSFRMAASQPRISDEYCVELFHARHPLLDPKTVVPIHILLGDKFDTLVITGPNTGGKTVSLKTLGLLSMMTQAGLHIPADDTSTMPVFGDILADIGDEQSIEQSLSTFSAHMVNIVNILNEAKRGSLVLLDELGAGTDPVEGAALAAAILESVRERGALCAATTHYAELKEYALNTEGVSNASCEFDVETLKPTFRLIIGTPGRSNAFAISVKLGLDESIVERARNKMSGNSRRFEDVIEKLEATRIEMENQREAAVKMRRDYEVYAANAEQALKTKIAETERELEKQHRKAAQMMESAKVSSTFVFEQLSELKKQKDSERFAEQLEEARDLVRRTLRETDDLVNPVVEKSAGNYIPPRPFAKGDEVLLVNINKTGVLLDTPDENGDVSVQAGIIKMRTNIKNLMLSDSDKTTYTDRDKKTVSATGYRTAVRTDLTNEINLRGMNGEDAWMATDKYLDEAKMAHLTSVRLIHGKGTGALRSALWRLLKGDPRIASFRIGQFGEGDSGVTVVELK